MQLYCIHAKRRSQYCTYSLILTPSGHMQVYLNVLGHGHVFKFCGMWNLGGHEETQEVLEGTRFAEVSQLDVP